MGAGDEFLRLHDFDGVSDASGEAIPRLEERFLGQINIAAGNFHLLGRGLQVENCSAHVGVDLCAEIIEALAGLFESRVGFESFAATRPPKKMGMESVPLTS